MRHACSQTPCICAKWAAPVKQQHECSLPGSAGGSLLLVEQFNTHSDAGEAQLWLLESFAGQCIMQLYSWISLHQNLWQITCETLSLSPSSTISSCHLSLPLSLSPSPLSSRSLCVQGSACKLWVVCLYTAIGLIPAHDRHTGAGWPLHTGVRVDEHPCFSPFQD